ncbi:MAG: YlxR family protein [Clostridiales bacterium]|nr:YlxR family protein [Clostridiales bacterium]
MKKVPMRRCIGCMESKNKKELLRIVRVSDTDVNFDSTGKMSGRGTYICSANCLNKAIKSKKIEKELNVKIDENTYNKLLVDINTYIK